MARDDGIIQRQHFLSSRRHNLPSSQVTHRRTGQHPFGGADPVLPEIFCGVPEFFLLTPVTDTNFGFFPLLTAVTDPKFVLFKHVLCFARIMSTLPEFMSTNCPTPRPVRL